MNQNKGVMCGGLCMGDQIIGNSKAERRKPALSRRHQTVSSDNTLPWFTSFIFLVLFISRLVTNRGFAMFMQLSFFHSLGEKNANIVF